jgi:hypothetical protein
MIVAWHGKARRGGARRGEAGQGKARIFINKLDYGRFEPELVK